MGRRDTWVIDEELSKPSDHEVVVCDIVHPQGMAVSKGISKEVTKSRLKAMSDDSRKKAAVA